MAPRPRPPRPRPPGSSRPRSSRQNGGGAAQAVIWIVAGAALAGLLIGGLYVFGGGQGPGPGISVAGLSTPPAESRPPEPAPAPSQGQGFSSGGLVPPEEPVLLPGGDTPSPMAPAVAPATPAPAAITSPAPPAGAPTLPAPATGSITDPAAPAGEAPPPPPLTMPGQARAATLEEIASRPPTRLTAYRAAHNPLVVILDFPSLNDQAQALNRAAALIEKKGLPRDRVMGDGELRQYIASSGKKYDTFYAGHDYSAAALARFFTLAEAGGITKPEGDVLEILLKLKVLRVADKGFKPGTPAQAVITLASIGADRPDNVEFRRDVLRHEMAHGEYFTHVFYRAQCQRFWQDVLSEAERRLFLRFFEKLDYDVTDGVLMVNEMQAFLGFTPSPRLFGAAKLGITEDEMAGLRLRFARYVTTLPEF